MQMEEKGKREIRGEGKPGKLIEGRRGEWKKIRKVGQREGKKKGY